MTKDINDCIKKKIINTSSEASFTHLDTNDVITHAKSLPNWSQEYLQISPGIFHGSLSNISLGPVQLFRESMNKAVDRHAQAWPNCLAIGIPLKIEGDGFWCGDKLLCDSILFLKPNAELKFRSPLMSDILVVAVDIELFINYSKETGFSITGDLNHLNGVTPVSKELCDSLRERFLRILEKVKSSPRILKEQATRHALTIEIMSVLLSSLSSLEKITPRHPGQFVHRHIVEKAREYILSRKGNPPNVLEICNELHISRRALHYAFQKVLTINPVTFLRYIRLHGARQELITEPSGKYLISEIAARWGFWTPGIFCNYYKELFGETPTATLRQHKKVQIIT